MTAPLGVRNFRAIGRITDDLIVAKALRSLTLCVDERMLRGRDVEELRFNPDIDISQSQVGVFLERLALMSTKLLKALHEAQESEDKVTGVLAIVQLDTSPCPEAVRQKIFDFWKKAVELRINDFKP